MQTGITRPMRAMMPESVQYASSGASLSRWKWGPLWDARDINRVLARRFQYGNFRPSDRAALLLDSSPILTPFAPDDVPMAAD